MMAPVLDATCQKAFRVSRKKKANWFTKMLAAEAQSFVKSPESEISQEDSGSEKGFFAGSEFHQQFAREKKEEAQIVMAKLTDEHYLKARPAQKISQMTNRQRNQSEHVRNLMLPLTGNPVLDSFLNSYCEVTQKSESVRIDITLWKQIAWTTGVPAIIVDLL
jgi:hypothetical protein